MGYNRESYRGTLGIGLRPISDANTLASPATTDGFVGTIESLRRGGTPHYAGFSRILQHADRAIVVQLHSEEEYRLPGPDQPLGLAVAHNVARSRRLLWRKGLAPGLYAVTKTIFAGPTDHGSGLQAGVQENTRSLVNLGRPVNMVNTRPANEDEVAEAIDTIFTTAVGLTTEYTADNTADNF